MAQVATITAIGSHRVANLFHAATRRAAAADAAAKTGDAPMAWILIVTTDAMGERQENTL